MALEPIGSIMTTQVPVQPKPAAPAAKPASEYTEVSTEGTAAQVDSTISIVESTREKGGADSQAGDGGQSGAGYQASNEQIKKAVETINRTMSNSEAVFGIHEGTNRVTIKIIDKSTKEVIKELPPEKTLDMIAKIWEMAGILVDEKR